MKTRILGRTGIQVSEIGMGCEGLEGKSTEESQRLVDCAMQEGIAFFDVYSSNPTVRRNLGGALSRYPREQLDVYKRQR